MGLDLILTDADEADAAAVAIEYIPAVTRGLLGWWSPAVSAEEGTRNFYLDGGAAGAISGTVIFAAGYATFSSGVGVLQTDIAETDNMTLMTWARSMATFADPANSPLLAGNLRTTSGVGLTLRKAALGTPAPTAQACFYGYVNSAGTPTSQLATVDVTDATVWDCYSGVVEAGVGVRIKAHKSGKTGARATALPRLLNTADKIQIGNNTFPNWGGSADIPLGVIHNVALTDAERDAQYLSGNAFLAARRGIVV